MSGHCQSSVKPMESAFAMKRGLVWVAVATAGILSACGGNEVETGKQAEALQEQAAISSKQADVAALYRLQADFHRAATTKDLDLMMSKWAENATLVVGGKRYTGKDQIRTFIGTQLGAFKPENHWVALTHSPKIQIATNGDVGTLQFQCHYADASTKELASMASADTKVLRSDEGWLFKEFIAGPATLSG
jgi:ketosteroid isomerase-like protein